MKITCISGSQNAGGNNEKLLDIVVGDGAHFGGIVTKPVESDDIGLKTVHDTVNMICDTLSRFK